jgi:hypothetical protein
MRKIGIVASSSLLTTRETEERKAGSKACSTRMAMAYAHHSRSLKLFISLVGWHWGTGGNGWLF